MGGTVSLILHVAVMGLLASTVVVCWRLDRRLRALRADEGAMRSTAMELAVATERAERAIERLRGAITEFDTAVAGRIQSAEQTSAVLAEQLKSGDEVLHRIGRIVSTARRAVDEAETRLEPAAPRAPAAPVAVVAPPPNAEATLAAAEAFAARARRRLDGAA